MLTQFSYIDVTERIFYVWFLSNFIQERLSSRQPFQQCTSVVLLNISFASNFVKKNI